MSELLFKQKYLKYKSKYLIIKQEGGEWSDGTYILFIPSNADNIEYIRLNTSNTNLNTTLSTFLKGLTDYKYLVIEPTQNIYNIESKDRKQINVTSIVPSKNSKGIPDEPEKLIKYLALIYENDKTYTTGIIIIVKIIHSITGAMIRNFFDKTNFMTPRIEWYYNYSVEVGDINDDVVVDGVDKVGDINDDVVIDGVDKVGDINDDDWEDIDNESYKKIELRIENAQKWLEKSEFRNNIYINPGKYLIERETHSSGTYRICFILLEPKITENSYNIDEQLAGFTDPNDKIKLTNNHHGKVYYQIINVFDNTNKV